MFYQPKKKDLWGVFASSGVSVIMEDHLSFVLNAEKEEEINVLAQPRTNLCYVVQNML